MTLSQKFLASRITRRALVAMACACLFAEVGRGQGRDEAPKISFEQFQNIPETNRDRTYRVEFDCTALYYDPEWKLLWVDYDGQPYYFDTGNHRYPIHSGDRIRINATMVPRRGTALIDGTISTIEGSAPVIPITPADVADFGSLNGKFVRLQGLAQAQKEIDAQHLYFELVSGKHSIFVRVHTGPKEPVPQLEGAWVSVEGIYVPSMDSMGALQQIDLWVPSAASLHVEGWLDSDPRFRTPVTSVQDALAMTTRSEVLVSGEVMNQSAGKDIAVQDSFGLITARTKQLLPPLNGKKVLVWGTYDPKTGHIEEALVRNFDGAEAARQGYRSKQSKYRLNEQILGLSPEQIRNHNPVQVSGLVTWAPKGADALYLLDPTGGIRVIVPRDQTLPSVGDFVTVSGVTSQSGFAPEITAVTLVPGGTRDFPAARSITLDQAMTGAEEGQWIEMVGYIKGLSESDGWTSLQLVTTSGDFAARLPSTSNTGGLLGSVVRIRGICTAVTNDRKQLVSVSLLCPGVNQIVIEEPAPADPFLVPVRSITSLRQFGSLRDFNHRIHISGTVIEAMAGEHLTIQDAESGIFVYCKDSLVLKPGDQVEVSGFPGVEGRRVIIREAVIRKNKSGYEPLAATLFHDGSSHEDLDNRLVVTEGVVLDASRRQNELRLQLQSGPYFFDASAIAALLPSKSDIPVGSILRLTGVCQVRYNELHQPTGYQIRLRDGNDIAVVNLPTWWTVERTAKVAASLGGFVLLAFTWATVLRKRVVEKTRQLQEQLEREAILEAHHKKIIESASDFIFTIDLQGKFLSFNQTGCELTGHSLDEALLLSIRDLVEPEFHGELDGVLALRSEQDGIVTFQARFVTKDGRHPWLETSARIVLQHGQEPCILGVARDISARKAIEDALTRARDAAEANTQAKSAFLANMSHEIRTPMNGVIGMSNLLLETKLTGEQHEYAHTIRSSAESLLSVLNDILDFSKIEAGKLEIERLPFNLYHLIDGVFELVGAQVAAKGLELSSHLEPAVPTTVVGDPSRLRQILLNLVGNAAKFTHQGEIHVAVGIQSLDTESVLLRFEVTDTGLGIPKEAQERLFQPFSQADGTTTRKFGGTGLGLAISKQIAELMDGSIGVRSTPGQGATFWFTARMGLGASVTSAAIPPIGGGQPVLVIDDSENARAMIEQSLRSIDFAPYCVGNFPDALRALNASLATQKPYPLIFLDHKLGTTPGLDLAAELRGHPAAEGCRIVYLCAWGHRLSAEEMSRRGIWATVMKPIRTRSIIATLGAWQSDEAQSSSIAPSHSRPPIEVNHTSSKRLRVLIAEDNLVNQRVSKRQVEGLGHDASLANNGREALALLAQNPYDVILMDGQMPEMDGFQATESIRNNPLLAHIPIIALTANAMQGDRDRFIAAGMDDYLTKPLKVDDLKAALERCIQPVSISR